MDDVKRSLEEKRDKLRADMEKMAAPPEETTGISFGKRVGEGTSIAVERLVQVATHDRDQVVLTEVDRALVKIEEGTYGQCDVCGGPIAPARLEALPWATLCVECA